MCSCSAWHNAQVETWALGMRCVAVLWGCAVGLLWSWVVWTWDLAVLGMWRDIHTGLCLCRVIQLVNEVLLVWRWHLGTVRFDPDQACQRVWAEFRYFPKCMDIGDVECMVSFYLFGRSFFLWLFMVSDRLCGCVPCLRYPRKGKSPRAYYYIIIIILNSQKRIKTSLVGKHIITCLMHSLLYSKSKFLTNTHWIKCYKIYSQSKWNLYFNIFSFLFFIWFYLYVFNFFKFYEKYIYLYKIYFIKF